VDFTEKEMFFICRELQYSKATLLYNHQINGDLDQIAPTLALIESVCNKINRATAPF